jgi:hypothetical protein
VNSVCLFTNCLLQILQNTRRIIIYNSFYQFFSHHTSFGASFVTKIGFRPHYASVRCTQRFLRLINRKKGRCALSGRLRCSPLNDIKRNPRRISVREKSASVLQLLFVQPCTAGTAGVCRWPCKSKFSGGRL